MGLSNSVDKNEYRIYIAALEDRLKRNGRHEFFLYFLKKIKILTDNFH